MKVSSLERTVVVFLSTFPPHMKRMFWSLYMSNRRVLRRVGVNSAIPPAVHAHHETMRKLRSN